MGSKTLREGILSPSLSLLSFMPRKIVLWQPNGVIVLIQCQLSSRLRNFAIPSLHNQCSHPIVAYSSPSHRCIFFAIPSLHNQCCHPIVAYYLVLPSHRCIISAAIPLLHIPRCIFFTSIFSAAIPLLHNQCSHPIVAYSSLSHCCILVQPSHCCIFFAIPSLHILCHPIVAYLVLPSHCCHPIVAYSLPSHCCIFLPSHFCIFSAAIPSLQIPHQIPSLHILRHPIIACEV